MTPPVPPGRLRAAARTHPDDSLTLHRTLGWDPYCYSSVTMARTAWGVLAPSHWRHDGTGIDSSDGQDSYSDRGPRLGCV